MLAYAVFLLITNNVHVVVPGEVYRSGQMRSGEMISLVQAYGIKSVLNRMSAKSGLSTKEIDVLIAIMKRSPKPLLVHCQGGADRTGLAAAL